MNTPFDLEERLRDTLADIVPQLIARAEAPTEVALLGEPAPARPQIAGTPRRWSILGAVAAVAAFVAWFGDSRTVVLLVCMGIVMAAGCILERMPVTVPVETKFVAVTVRAIRSR